MAAPTVDFSPSEVEQAPASSAQGTPDFSPDEVEQAPQPQGPVNPYANKPANAEPKPRSLWQRYKDNFAAGAEAIDVAAQSEPLDTSSVGGFVKSVGSNLGAGATRMVASPLAHPIDTVAGMAKMGRAAFGDTGAQIELGEEAAQPFIGKPGGEAIANIPQAALLLTGGERAVNPENRFGVWTPREPKMLPPGEIIPPEAGEMPPPNQGGGPGNAPLPSSGGGEGGGGVATATRTQVKAPPVRKVVSPVDQAIAEKMAAERAEMQRPQAQQQLWNGTKLDQLRKQFFELQKGLDRARAMNDADGTAAIQARMDAADAAWRQEYATQVGSMLDKMGVNLSSEQRATIGEQASGITPNSQAPISAQTAAAYVASVKGGVPPAAAAVAFGLSQAHQEAAHVGAALMPNTLGGLVKAAAPPAAVAATNPAPPPPPPAPDAVGQQQQAQQSTIEEAAANAQQIQNQAQQIAQGTPPPPPPEVPLPVGMADGLLSEETVNQAGSLIMRLPATIRPKAILESVGNIAKWMDKSKTIIAPDGTVVNVDSQEMAQREAVKLINNEIKRQNELIQQKHDAQVEAQKKQQEDAQAAQEEREAVVTGEAEKPAETPETGPVEIPQTPAVQKARAALRSAPDHFTAEKLEALVRNTASVTTPVRKALVQEEIRRRANRQEDQAQTAMTGTETPAGQSREELQRWADAVGRGDEPYLHVPKGSSFVPAGVEKLKKTAVNGAGKFSGTYYHHPEISEADIRTAARDKHNPQAALDALTAKFKQEKNMPEFAPHEVEIEEKPVEIKPESKPNENVQNVQKKPEAETKPSTEVAKEEEPETKPAEPETKYKFGSTQADIPPDSPAGKALAALRAKIDPADLMGDGLEKEAHITVRWGIQDDDVSGIRSFIKMFEPFEATLGKTESFPASEHSDGAVPIIVPVEAKSLRIMEKDMDGRGNFAERSFPEYRPHATVAYVKPEAAEKYVGLTDADGKTFKVESVSISDRNGDIEEVKLKTPAVAKPEAETKPEPAAKPAIKVGDKIKFKDFAGNERQGIVKALKPNGQPVVLTDSGHRTPVPLDKIIQDEQPVETPAEAKSLQQYLYDHIDKTGMPADNNALRKIVADFDGKPVDQARQKEAQEALEAAIARRAHEIVTTMGGSDEHIYNALIKLYEAQPNLNIRTSTSIGNQAYSTPAPLAFLAGRLAEAGPDATVYEPTAGNGMLLITADPAKVFANELEPGRAANLKAQGFHVTEKNAVDFVPVKTFDSVLANPPFGPLKDAAGENIKESIDGYKVGQLDHVIAARALEAMKDNGKATLILGAGKLEGEISNDTRIFLNWLYGNYNVTGQFEMDGDLYSRQGAGWPVRIISINGRMKSDQVGPAPGEIKRASTWKDVYDKFSESLAAQGERRPAQSAPRSSGALQPKQDEAKPVRSAPGTKVAGGNRAGSGGSAPESRNEPEEAPQLSGDQHNVSPERVANSDRNERPDANAPEPGGLEKPGPSGNETAVEPARTPRATRSNALADEDNQYQVKYSPRSSKKDEDVLIPTNMREALDDAMESLEKNVGDIDEYARKELGYKTVDEMHDALMGLQVDAVASAIHQIKLGKAAIIADQTGIGKGRQAAAMIRWAIRQNKVPVFMTATPELFSDIHGDLGDIGSPQVQPFIVNADEAVTTPEGKKLFKMSPAQRKRDIASITATGELPEDKNAMFITYSQINKAINQREMLRRIAPNAVFILDESHRAAGESSTGEFMLDMVGKASGVTYLSATYAKRPDNMPLYHRTDIGMAIKNKEKMFDVMARGGLPLQTVVSNNLVKAGQMFRRERSYDGIEIRTEVDTARGDEHREMADKATEGLRSIVKADQHFSAEPDSTFAPFVPKGGGKTSQGGNKASQSVSHTEFTAIVHNFVRQMLFGMKADSAADKAIAALKAGEKPIIAVDNTMGSFLNEYAEDHNLSSGHELKDFDYRTVLTRALARTRRLLVKKANGDTEVVNIPVSALSEEAQEFYKRAQATIDKLDLPIPVSPIDHIRMRLKKAGYSVAEITGRNAAVDYTGSVPKLTTVPHEEQNDRVKTTQKFNSGNLDALIMNVAGSTGISLHAAKKFKDQRVRHMIIAQPAQDINVFMQMLGRIHRTGQVKLPRYTILNVDLPAEKRPTALLSKKMKSLNANTSSNTESATSVKAADLLNKYGDETVANYLAYEDPALRRALHVDVNEDEKTGEPTGSKNPDLARKATGRLALMPIVEQDKFYRNVERLYNEYIDYLNSTNQNDLEPKTLDYGAKLKKEQVIHEGADPSTPFGQNATYGEYSIKSQGKPMTPDEVQAKVNESLAGFDGRDEWTKAREKGRSVIAPAEAKYAEFLKTLPTDGDAIQKANNTRQLALSAIQNYPVGTGLGIVVNEDPVNAVITNVQLVDTGGGNPFSLSKIKFDLAVASPIHHLKVSEPQLRKIAGQRNYRKINDIFDPARQSMQQDAKIVTGNLLGAYGQMNEAKGRIIHFTKENGESELGILLPNSFDVGSDIDRSYTFRNPNAIVPFLEKTNNEFASTIGVAAPNGNIRITLRGNQIQLMTPTSKKLGSKYFLDRELVGITGDFVSTGTEMRVTIPKDKAPAAIKRIMELTTLEVPASKGEEARAIADQGKPKGGSVTMSFLGTGSLDEAATKALQPAVDYAKKAGAATWNELVSAVGKTGTSAKKMGREVVGALYPAALAESDVLDIMGGALGEPALRQFEAGQFLHGVSKMFDALPQEEWTSFVDRIERGEDQPTKDLKNAAEMIKGVLETQRERENEAINLGRPENQQIELTNKDDYFPHRYRLGPGREAVPDESEFINSIGAHSRRPFEGSKAFMKQQRYTYKEAIEEGAEPIGNPVKMVLKRLQEGAKFVGARYAIYNFKHQGVMLFLRKGKPIPQHFNYIEDKFANVWRMIESTEETPTGENRKYPVQTGRWIMQEDAARLLNNYLSKDYIRGSEIGNAFIKMKNASTEARLAISAFHWMYITVENMASGINQGLDQFYNQGIRGLDPTKMSAGLIDLGKSLVAPYTAIKRGGKIIDYARNPDEFWQSKEGIEWAKRYPDFPHLMDLLFKGNLRWDIADTYKQSFGDGFVEDVQKGELGKGLGKFVPWLAHTIARPLFEHYIPRSKWAFAVELLSKKLEQYSYAIAEGTKTEIEIAREVAETTDNRFGEFNWDSLYLNANVRTAVQFFFRSATWKLGSWRGLAKAGQETFTAKAFDDQIFKKMDELAKTDPSFAAQMRKYSSRLPQLGVNAGWILSMGLTVAMLGGTFERLATGKSPAEWAAEDSQVNGMSVGANMALESMHPRTGAVDKNGIPIRLSFPTGLKDYEHGFEDPIRYLKGSESDIVSNAWDTLANQDAFGDYVYNPQDPGFVKLWDGLKYNAEGDFTPMSASNFARQYGAQDLPSKLLRATGMVGGAPKELDRSHALTQALEMRRPHTPLTPEQKHEREMAKEQSPTHRQIMRAAREKNMDYLERVVNDQLSYTQAMQIYNDPKTTDAERKTLKPIIDRKRARMVKSVRGR